MHEQDKNIKIIRGRKFSENPKVSLYQLEKQNTQRCSGELRNAVFINSGEFLSVFKYSLKSKM